MDNDLEYFSDVIYRKDEGGKELLEVTEINELANEFVRFASDSTLKG